VPYLRGVSQGIGSNGCLLHLRLQPQALLPVYQIRANPGVRPGTHGVGSRGYRLNIPHGPAGRKQVSRRTDGCGGGGPYGIQAEQGSTRQGDQ
jgi:hypothetical protein